LHVENAVEIDCHAISEILLENMIFSSLSVVFLARPLANTLAPSSSMRPVVNTPPLEVLRPARTSRPST
jgi:hypothetical protein